LELNRARVDARNKNPQSALKRLEVCFKEKLASEGTLPYELLAEVLGQLGKKKELLSRLEKLRRSDPENVPLGYFLAAEYVKAEQVEKAEPLYRDLADRAPTLTAYRSLIEIYRKTHRPAPLIAILGDAVEKTGVLDTLGAEARAVSDDADLVRDVIKTARKMLAEDAGEFDYGMRLAVALLALESEQLDVAGEFFDLAIKTRPEAAKELLMVWGVGLLVEERAAEAVKVFRRAIDEKVAPDDNPAFHFYLAGALEMNGRTEEALATARKAAETALSAARKADEEARAARKTAENSPADRLAVRKAVAAAEKAAQKKASVPRFRSRGAWILYHAKRYGDAIKAYRRLIEEFDSDYKSSEIRTVLREARMMLSNLHVIQEDLAEAEEWLEQVLDEFPDDVGAANDLGYLWADQGKHLHRALTMIQHAIDAEPDNVAYRDSLGWVYYRLGRYPDAVVELEKAAAGKQGEEPDAVILDHLGDVYLKVNQPRKARDAWQRAVTAFQKQDESKKAKAVKKKIKQLK